MGLFRKKASEEPVPEPTVRDDAGWREWASMGFSQFEEGNTPNAVRHWVGAVDRYNDPTPKQLQILRNNIYKAFLDQLKHSTRNGKVVPLHMVSEVDAEIYVKHHGIFDGHLTEDLFYDVKEAVPEAAGPQEIVMLYISAAFSSVGYLRYSADIRETISKCHETVLLGRYSCDRCQEYERQRFEGRLKPKSAIEFMGAMVYTFEQLQSALEKALDEMTEEQYLALTEYRRNNVVDRLEHIGALMHLSINANGLGHISRKKLEEGLSSEIPAYVGDFLRMD